MHSLHGCRGPRRGEGTGPALVCTSVSTRAGPRLLHAFAPLVPALREVICYRRAGT